MRQSGVIAAAGLYALENNVERLADDHANAERLAKGLAETGLDARRSTNMVMVAIAPEKLAALAEHLKKQRILVLARSPMRLVTHLDVDNQGIVRTISAFGSFFK
jgi:threonine aldolase